MPYNTQPIAPRKEVTGQTQLPLSRVKKIIGVDPDISICSNNAAFAITLATELFIQYLAEQGQTMAKMDRKPRRNVQYKDLATAVNHKDNLEFLEDVIPKTTPYKQIKEKTAATRAKLSNGTKTGAEGEDASLPNGKKQKSLVNGTLNGFATSSKVLKPEDIVNPEVEEEPRPVAHDGDVQMTG